MDARVSEWVRVASGVDNRAFRARSHDTVPRVAQKWTTDGEHLPDARRQQVLACRGAQAAATHGHTPHTDNARTHSTRTVPYPRAAVPPECAPLGRILGARARPRGTSPPHAGRRRARHRAAAASPRAASTTRSTPPPRPRPTSSLPAEPRVACAVYVIDAPQSVLWRESKRGSADTRSATHSPWLCAADGRGANATVSPRRRHIEPAGSRWRVGGHPHVPCNCPAHEGASHSAQHGRVRLENLLPRVVCVGRGNGGSGRGSVDSTMEARTSVESAALKADEGGGQKSRATGRKRPRDPPPPLVRISTSAA